jgi:hypothetical protein
MGDQGKEERRERNACNVLAVERLRDCWEMQEETQSLDTRHRHRDSAKAAQSSYFRILLYLILIHA